MRFFIVFIGLLLSATTFSQQLVLKSYQGFPEIETFKTSGLGPIHYLGQDFIIATVNDEISPGMQSLKQNPWSSGNYYFLVWLSSDGELNGIKQLNEQYTVLYSDFEKAIVEVDLNEQPGPMPSVHGGVVRISPQTQWEPKALQASRYVVDTIPEIYDWMAMVDTGAYMPIIQHLENYGTRYCQSPEAVEAQNWIKAKFEEYPELIVELQDFPFWGACSDNVIATLPGQVNPDQYIVVGSHYDSYSWGGTAPGADDNASGTAAVLELARILSQFEFEKSIVFCTFSAEEVGLVGSEYYASQAQAQGMDILGYFNFDMIGYRNGNDPIHTDMIAPSSASELVDFYKDVVAIYLPDFDVYDAQLSGGDSDHTSFNNNGYMGIFPFEDVPNYSPYIHTSQDLIGPSVNSTEMATTFIQANLASVATLSTPHLPVGVADDYNPVQAVRLFPNPAISALTIQPTTGGQLQISILSSVGQPVRKLTVSGRTTVDISSLAAGIYFVHVQSSNYSELHKLIVVTGR